MSTPQTLDDLLVHLPGLRRLRNLNADLLRVLLDRQEGECTWCGAQIPMGRRTWCGEACVTAFKERCDVNTVRRLVEQRDRGICQLCKRDTLAAERDAIASRLTVSTYPRELHGNQSAIEAWRHERTLKLFAVGFARGRWREVDHREPVVEYGGLCELSALRHLCGACHIEETERLHQRRLDTRKAKQKAVSA